MMKSAEWVGFNKNYGLTERHELELDLSCPVHFVGNQASLLDYASAVAEISTGILKNQCKIYLVISLIYDQTVRQPRSVLTVQVRVAPSLIKNTKFSVKNFDVDCFINDKTLVESLSEKKLSFNSTPELQERWEDKGHFHRDDLDEIGQKYVKFFREVKFSDGKFDKLRITFYAEYDSDHTEQVPLAILKPTLGKFYNSSSFSDMTIVCDGVEFPVHRIILSLASPMFQTMFETKLKESEESRVIIDEYDKTTMELLLTWIYSAKLEMEDDLLDVEANIKLYKAAHYYCIEPLKGWIKNRISSGKHFHAENALTIFAWAKIYDEVEILEKVKVIIRRDKNVVWKDAQVVAEFAQEYPEFIQELLLEQYNKSLLT